MKIILLLKAVTKAFFETKDLTEDFLFLKKLMLNRFYAI